MGNSPKQEEDIDIFGDEPAATEPTAADSFPSPAAELAKTEPIKSKEVVASEQVLKIEFGSGTYSIDRAFLIRELQSGALSMRASAELIVQDINYMLVGADSNDASAIKKAAQRLNKLMEALPVGVSSDPHFEQQLEEIDLYLELATALPVRMRKELGNPDLEYVDGPLAGKRLAERLGSNDMEGIQVLSDRISSGELDVADVLSSLLVDGELPATIEAKLIALTTSLDTEGFLDGLGNLVDYAVREGHIDRNAITYAHRMREND